MIKTDKQFKSALKQIESFHYTLKSLKQRNLPAHEEKEKTNKINHHLTELNNLCDAYQITKQSSPADIAIANISDLMTAPIKYRIAAGMSISVFAQYVSVSEMQITRYEREEYKKINMSTFAKILNAINIELSCRIIY